MLSALGLAAIGLQAYISGKSLVPMLQLLHVQYEYVHILTLCVTTCFRLLLYILDTSS